MKLEVELKGLDKFKDIMDSDVYQKAMRRTIRDEGRRFRTTAVKEVKKTYNIKAARLKKAISVSGSNGSWRMRVRSRAIGLYNFGAKQTKKGVTYKVKKSGSRKLIEGAFIARGKNNNKPRVFIRKSDGQLKSEYRLSPTQMFTKEILEIAKKGFETNYVQTFEKNLNFYLKNS